MKDKRAADIMSQPVITVRPDAPLFHAVKLLLRHHVSGLPVVDSSGTLLGLISEYDIMNFALSGNADQTRVDEAMTRKVITQAADASVPALINCLVGGRLRRVPIVEGGRVVGIVSRRDILREMLFMYGR